MQARLPRRSLQVSFRLPDLCHQMCLTSTSPVDSLKPPFDAIDPHLDFMQRKRLEVPLLRFPILLIDTCFFYIVHLRILKKKGFENISIRFVAWNRIFGIEFLYHNSSIHDIVVVVSPAQERRRSSMEDSFSPWLMQGLEYPSGPSLAKGTDER